MIKKKNISLEDIKIWKNYIKNPSDIIDKDSNNNKSRLSKRRYKFDLHGYSLTQANDKVRDLILYCSKENFKEILLITGKGIHSNTDEDVFVSKELSKLKYSVPDYLRSNNNLSKYISSISDSSEKDGGTGAIIIKLK